jgi:hypothetical protein
LHGGNGAFIADGLIECISSEDAIETAEQIDTSWH